MRAGGCWLVAFLLTIGCSGSVVRASGSGSGGAGGTGATGPGGTGGVCARTNGHAAISVTSMDGTLTDCAHVSSPDGGVVPAVPDSIEGQVQDVTPTSFKVDTCPPNANCVDLYTFRVRAPGLTLALPASAFVHVDYQFSAGCTQNLDVKSLDTWAGLPNPEPLGHRLLLSISDGYFSPSKSSESVYKVQPVALGCDPETVACGGQNPDEYALDFSPAAAPNQTVRVYMGKTKAIDLLQTQGPGVWYATNLRSYETANCDDNDFAWFIAWQPPTK